MERMTANSVRHIPVVDRDRLVGIVSIGDIVKHRLWEMEQESAAIQPRNPKGDITSPSATVRKVWCAGCGRLGYGAPSLAARRVKDQPT
jgi:CBS-domain-containing membrane protein